ncbi:dihydroneopterin aldolase [candidate division KSB1 bacterium]|nr:dihydroneopterin aldolase [candidate division KSB1 bacterium]NIR72136.1 dihydroneopterin aldolase [candidate division KSB1 bacterium]NIS26601.1 dihydroneopterin aldolase [candidate division KSB1 bacterium]NIU27217.1 dihydroneopterin aldolase [candidate division KSB1 bacterium]NIU93649.1 dihydroneopterin aldolase [candidate division KSB1 bacterium]
MASDKVKLKNMTFHAFHGVWDEEREIGQRFEVDVELGIDAKAAAKTDKLKSTADLSAVFDTVESFVAEGKFRLLESMAEGIAQAILDRFKVSEVLVRVRKPHAPIRGIQDGIEVEILRNREDYVEEA